MTAAGITLCVASGDAGSRSSNSAYGRTNSTTYEASFPASIGNAVAVGATMLGVLSGTTVTEVAASSFNGAGVTSGGGFSSWTPRPSRQTSVINTYQTNYNTGLSYATRGVPDVSALGNAIIIYLTGSQTSISGTSASAPIFAGMVTLMNDYRIVNAPGTGTVKNFPQFLYNLASSNTNAIAVDVISGCGCVGESGSVSNNYPLWTVDCYNATTGWDPISGLGTINFPTFQVAAATWTPPTSSPPTPQPAVPTSPPTLQPPTSTTSPLTPQPPTPAPPAASPTPEPITPEPETREPPVVAPPVATDSPVPTTPPPPPPLSTPMPTTTTVNVSSGAPAPSTTVVVHSKTSVPPTPTTSGALVLSGSITLDAAANLNDPQLSKSIEVAFASDCTVETSATCVVTSLRSGSLILGFSLSPTKGSALALDHQAFITAMNTAMQKAADSGSSWLVATTAALTDSNPNGIQVLAVNLGGTSSSISSLATTGSATNSTNVSPAPPSSPSGGCGSIDKDVCTGIIVATSLLGALLILAAGIVYVKFRKRRRRRTDADARTAAAVTTGDAGSTNHVTNDPFADPPAGGSTTAPSGTSGRSVAVRDPVRRGRGDNNTSGSNPLTTSTTPANPQGATGGTTTGSGGGGNPTTATGPSSPVAGGGTGANGGAVNPLSGGGGGTGATAAVLPPLLLGPRSPADGSNIMAAYQFPPLPRASTTAPPAPMLPPLHQSAILSPLFMSSDSIFQQPVPMLPYPSAQRAVVPPSERMTPQQRSTSAKRRGGGASPTKDDAAALQDEQYAALTDSITRQHQTITRLARVVESDRKLFQSVMLQQQAALVEQQQQQRIAREVDAAAKRYAEAVRKADKEAAEKERARKKAEREEAEEEARRQARREEKHWRRLEEQAREENRFTPVGYVGPTPGPFYFGGGGYRVDPHSSTGMRNPMVYSPPYGSVASGFAPGGGRRTGSPVGRGVVPPPPSSRHPTLAELIRRSGQGGPRHMTSPIRGGAGGGRAAEVSSYDDTTNATLEEEEEEEEMRALQERRTPSGRRIRKMYQP